MQSLRQWVGLCGAALLAVTVALAPAPARAQDPDKKVTLNLRDTPLRDAINLLFTGSGLQYSVDPNVPNVPVTLNVRDTTLTQALRLIIKQAAGVAPGLTFNRDGDIYTVRIRPPMAAAPPDQGPEVPPEGLADASELVWEKIPIQFNDV